ncbi:hypothetical protein AK830_g7441 [Neonectria ditissima]|uniref:Alpha box domain-containing protein n=1 Tax=Neonectria ditissima TaxID=78410 RepID=A0A0N8H6J1_9HYPO|nr:hypothetical protein AK830_g7441 [Neonectria ditissima]
MSRARAMQQLSTMSADDILRLLTDDTIREVAARSFSNSSSSVDANEPISPSSDTSPPDEAPRAKRPLNAFMAFRSYYLKLFPDVQMKTASGLLTTLWAQDPFRSKWTLIAKVYSFVRDEVGRTNISLSRFLDVCCPVMKIIHPVFYLGAFGWTVQFDEDGPCDLVQDDAARLDQFQDEIVPENEMDLLRALLQTGYLSEQAFALMDRMTSNNSSLLATHGISAQNPVLVTTGKWDYIALIHTSPTEAARLLMGGEEIQPGTTYAFHLHGMGDAPFTLVEEPEPNAVPHYGFSHASFGLDPNQVLDVNNLNEFEAIDIDNPFDVDAVMGHDETEAERTIGEPAAEDHDPHADFNSVV